MRKYEGTLEYVWETDLQLLKDFPEEFWADVADIGPDAFSRREGLTEIDIPETVARVYEAAFRHCHNLKRVSLKKETKYIGCWAFSYCSNLEEINFDKDSVVNLQVGDGAFQDCKALKRIVFPRDICLDLGKEAFKGCSNLEEIVFPEIVNLIGSDCFKGCEKIKELTVERCFNIDSNALPETVEKLIFIDKSGIYDTRIPEDDTFLETRSQNHFKYIYVSKDLKKITLTKEKDDELEKSCYVEDYTYVKAQCFLREDYFRSNYSTLQELKKSGEVKSIPLYILAVFPPNDFENFFTNKNNEIWGKLRKAAGISSLREQNNEKLNASFDMFKIYYALGGFSGKKEESEKAYNYVYKNIIQRYKEPEEIAKFCHEKFENFRIVEYNPNFAKFFMQYFAENPNFMTFTPSQLWQDVTVFNQNNPVDYLAKAHNSFRRILVAYPNSYINKRDENGKKRLNREILTPEKVARSAGMETYEGVLPGNEDLSKMVGMYGYSQETFERMQKVFENAKKIKDKAVIKADNSVCDKKDLQFRVLEKDDPFGFVLGDITNCCQRFDSAAETCVVDGYENPLSGFIVFEQKIKGAKGVIGTLILGQAYVWYDPVEKTVCFDNIEVPSKVLSEFANGTGKFSKRDLVDLVEDAATSIIKTMNANGVEVDEVTTGEGYNDLRHSLALRFVKELDPDAKAPANVYSDAKNAQYILKTYDEVTKMYGDTIRQTAEEIEEDFNQLGLVFDRDSGIEGKV